MTTYKFSNFNNLSILKVTNTMKNVNMCVFKKELYFFFFGNNAIEGRARFLV